MIGYIKNPDKLTQPKNRNYDLIGSLFFRYHRVIEHSLHESNIAQQICHPHVTSLICHPCHTSRFSIFTKYSGDLEFFRGVKSYLSLSVCHTPIF